MMKNPPRPLFRGAEGDEESRKSFKPEEANSSLHSDDSVRTLFEQPAIRSAAFPPHETTLPLDASH
jgi:hypothetical protein